MKYILSFLVIITLNLTRYNQVLTFVAGDTLIKNIDVDDYTPAWTKITNLLDTTVILNGKLSPIIIRLDGNFQFVIILFVTRMVY